MADESLVGRKAQRGERGRILENNAQVEHGVHLGVSHLLPDVGTNHFDFLLRVAQLSREERVSECFEPFRELKVVPRADFFLFVR